MNAIEDVRHILGENAEGIKRDGGKTYRTRTGMSGSFLATPCLFMALLWRQAKCERRLRKDGEKHRTVILQVLYAEAMSLRTQENCTVNPRHQPSTASAMAIKLSSFPFGQVETFAFARLLPYHYPATPTGRGLMYFLTRRPAAKTQARNEVATNVNQRAMQPIKAKWILASGFRPRCRINGMTAIPANGFAVGWKAGTRDVQNRGKVRQRRGGAGGFFRQFHLKYCPEEEAAAKQRAT
ncbi:hypothetical protein B0H19DRAFT_1083212 [Mycena capillaripes]|nr:hypothetical protein B0H19DRAFT_1083212 [Mycena capillaripes]